MAYEEFIADFAAAQGIEGVETLLRDHAVQYSFQITSRDRAKVMLEAVVAQVGDVRGLKLLDVGCAYGAFAIEFTKAGAEVIGIDVNEKWLRLAESNAKGEAEVQFYRCDAAQRVAVETLGKHAPFDLVILNDVLEHIYDTAGLLENLTLLLRPGGRVYFKVPNGQATRHVISEGHKKVFGISLLAPDYWQWFVKAPFHIYYRRWAYFEALFTRFGFSCEYRSPNHDPDRETTCRHIKRDLEKIEAGAAQGDWNPLQARTIAQAVQAYAVEAASDIESLDWPALHLKYRVTFWEGVLTRESVQVPSTSAEAVSAGV